MPEVVSVLVVEDDPALAELVAEFLRSNGFIVAIESRGDRAVPRILAEQPQVVVLDVMLPGLDGLAVCRAVRREFHGAILVLTARGEEIDEVLSLEMGADDFMAKPVRPRALLARISALLRRNAREIQPKRVTLGRLVVDSAQRTSWLDGQALDLSSGEFDVLWALVEHTGEVVERDELYQKVRGIAWDGQDRSIDLRISRLRRKLGDEAKPHQIIKSVRGTGYLLAGA